MSINFDAFLQSLPIMGVGLLGIFIVTIVLILGIYLLKAISPKDDDAAKDGNVDDLAAGFDDNISMTGKKESAMDLMKEREKKDFFKEEESNYISHDL